MKYFFDTEFIEGFYKPLFGKRRHFIDLISIGIVAEDGREYHAISSEYKYDDADPWVKENVILPLYLATVNGDARNLYGVNNFHKHFGGRLASISENIKMFCSIGTAYDHYPNHTMFQWLNDNDPTIMRKIREYNLPHVFYINPIEFYGYYADYDWVLLCSLFGRMIDLPKGFPMYCRDLKQMLDEKAYNFVTGNKMLLAKYAIDICGLSPKQRLDYIKNNVPGYPKQDNEHLAIDDARWNKKLYEFLQTI